MPTKSITIETLFAIALELAQTSTRAKFFSFMTLWEETMTYPMTRSLLVRARFLAEKNQLAPARRCIAAALLEIND